MNIEKANLEFSSLNMLFGKPASGKSAVFEAISVCLSSNKRSNTYGEYVRQGCDNAKIHLEFILNGKPAVSDIQINKVNGTPYSGTLSYAGKIYKNSEIQTFLEAENVEYYLNIMFSMQHDKDITEHTPARRLDYIKELFNFNFDEQLSEIANLINTDKEKINQLNANYNANIIIEKELQRVETKKAGKFDIVKLESEIAQLKEKQSASIIEHSHFERLRKELTDIKSKLNDLLYAKQVTSFEITNKKSAAEKKSQSINKIDALNIEIAKNKDLLGTIDLLKPQVEIESLKSAIMAAKENVMKLKIEMADLESKYKLIVANKCPECGQPTNNIAGGLEAVNSAMKQVKAKSETTEKLYNDLTKELSLKEEVYSNNKMLKNKIEVSLAHLQEERNLIVNDLNFKSEDSDIEQLEEKLAATEKDIGLIQGKISAIESELKSELEIINYDSLIQQVQQNIFEEKQIIEYNRGVDLRNNERKEKLIGLQANQEDIEQKILLMNSDREVYDEANSVLNKLLPQYMSKYVCENLESRINAFINKIFPDYYVILETGKKGCELKYTKNKNIVDEKRNKYIDARMSSGLERCVLNLAFKQALAESYALDLFVGDEIDKAANDADSIELIKSILYNNYNQIFLISHKKSTFDYICDNYEEYTYYETNGGRFTKRT